jgi:hypothetical protein
MNSEQDQLLAAYRNWWHNEGSAMAPLLNEDRGEYVRRITEIAWLNGAYVQKYKAEKNTVEDVDREMQMIPASWRNRWCDSQTCACMGCANISGGLCAKGYTKEDWEQWRKRNALTFDGLENR